MSNIQALADTLHKLAKPDMKPKELVSSVRKKHPDATKKQVARAAFFCLIQDASSDDKKSKRLRALAPSKQADDKVDDITSQNLEKLRKKDKKVRKLKKINC